MKIPMLEVVEKDNKVEFEIIEAIPIVWLMQNMVNFDNDTRACIHRVISQWRKENDKRRD